MITNLRMELFEALLNILINTFMDDKDICLLRGGALVFLMLTGLARTERRSVPSLLFLLAVLLASRLSRSPRKVRLSRFWK